MAEDFVCTPTKLIENPPAGNKGGPGTYNQTPGLPGRTPSPNALPEKFFDANPAKK